MRLKLLYIHLVYRGAPLDENMEPSEVSIKRVPSTSYLISARRCCCTSQVCTWYLVCRSRTKIRTLDFLRVCQSEVILPLPVFYVPGTSIPGTINTRGNNWTAASGIWYKNLVNRDTHRHYYIPCTSHLYWWNLLF